MRAARKNYLPALVCALLPILCYFVIRPYAEIGIADDWVYIRDALNVALTGRIGYSGGETPMLGWQLYFGALFIRLFGFSFTTVRFSTVVEAMATALLLERIGARAGLNSRNAVLLTAIFVLSPLYFPFAYTFMSDVPGMLCVAVCLYMCLRAVQAESERAAMAWVSLAALVNAVGGTARQIDWLGFLVMVPCTLWLLRKSRRVVAAGGLSCVVGLGFILFAMHWHKQQPYIVSVPPIPKSIGLDFLKNGGRVVLGGAGVLALFALPVLLLFAGSLRSWKRRAAAAIVAILAMAPIHFLKIDKWPANAAFDTIPNRTFERLNAIAARATHLSGARDGLRVLLTAATVFGLLCLALRIFDRAQGRRAPRQEDEAISWQKLAVILVPFCAAYLWFVTMAFVIYDRYFLPLLAILLLLLVRYYQDYVKAKLSWACILPIALFGAFSLAATHDEFALNRGFRAAAGELESSGVPANAILGPQGWEGWAELEKTGHLGSLPKASPERAAPGAGDSVPTQCDRGLYFLILLGMVPSIRPAFAVSFNPNECGGQAALPPVISRTWVAPRANWIYAVRLPQSIAH